MTASRKLAHKRRTLLQLAEKLGNVSKACRLHKVSRSQFYEYKRSFQERGLEGLVDKPPVPLSHPNQLPEKTRSRIIELSLEHPAFGPQCVADQKQIRLLEKANPEFVERHVQSDYPGPLLCQDTFYVGRLKGVGRIYLQAAAASSRPVSAT